MVSGLAVVAVRLRVVDSGEFTMEKMRDGFVEREVINFKFFIAEGERRWRRFYTGRRRLGSCRGFSTGGYNGEERMVEN